MSREIGDKVEVEAARLLKKNKFQILEKNFSCKFGEIDIIAFDKTQNVLVFVEVKYRKSAKYGSALEMLSYAKQQKVLKTAQLYLLKNSKFENVDYRFDLMAKTGGQFNWIQNVIQS